MQAEVITHGKATMETTQTENNEQTKAGADAVLLPGKGLLCRFINEQALRYIETAPTRHAARKGQRPFSTKKYIATLMALTALTKKRLAEQLGVNYVVLRSWFGEAAFKRQVQENRNAFLDCFLAYARVLFEQKESPSNEEFFEVWEDGAWYGGETLKAIIQRVDADLEHAEDFGGQAMFTLHVCTLCHGIMQREGRDAVRKGRMLLLTVLLTFFGRLAQSLIDRAPTPGQEQEHQQALKRIIEAIQKVTADLSTLMSGEAAVEAC
jgi:hypothetical protein